VTTNRPTPRQVSSAVHHLFPQAAHLIVEPVEAGVSTWVDRLRHDDQVFYVRILPKPGASLVPESIVHDRLQSLGLRVPRVMMVEDRNAVLDRSVMVTTAIQGQPLSEITPGQELALLNQLAVDGFGWIRRDQPVSTNLVGEHASYRSWVEAPLDEALSQLSGIALTDADVAIVSSAVAATFNDRADTSATLAHGDLDVTHVYQDDGHYTGIIDFGEIRGADRWYDLAHVYLHDREHIPISTLRWLLDGYEMVTALPDDIDMLLAVDGVVDGLLALARSHRKAGRISSAYQRFLLQAIQRDITTIREMH
jgi:aminoglycoside phosphotransferase (APT) family kinase protein